MVDVRKRTPSKNVIDKRKAGNKSPVNRGGKEALFESFATEDRAVKERKRSRSDSIPGIIEQNDTIARDALTDLINADISKTFKRFTKKK